MTSADQILPDRWSYQEETDAWKKIPDSLRIRSLPIELKADRRSFESNQNYWYMIPNISQVFRTMLSMALSLTLILTSFSSHAQDGEGNILPENVRYRGYTLGAGTQKYTLSSDIPDLNGLNVTREGGSVGVYFGNKLWVVRSAIGLFYSSPSVPYTIDVMEVGTAANIYFLQFGVKQYRTIEPYFSVSAKGTRSAFFGTFLQKGNTNYSVADEDLVGRINSLQGFAGLGAEYQLQGTSEFFHFFAELRYGVTIGDFASADVLTGTRTHHPMSLVAGVNFGRIKYKSNGKRNRKY